MEAGCFLEAIGMSRQATPMTNRPKAAQTGPQRKAGRQQRSTPDRETYRHGNRSVDVPAGFLVVGYITGVHGLRGEVRVEPYTDFPERFAPGTQLFLGDDLAEVEVVAVRPHKNQILLQMKGIERREQADALRNTWLFIEEADAVELDEDTYWVHDIIGMNVQTADGERLGTIREVLFTGANEVYVVETPATVNQGKDLLLPAIADVVQKVDLAENLMTVRLLPGLLEQ
jgi:16S rRNA processing protein RimM